MNILKLFINDLTSVVSHIFVVVMVLGISILPSLYAWINIYANGNPYENTGQIPVAASSADKGIDLADGTHINIAKEQLHKLKERESIDYIIVKDPKEAIEGVRSGKYYAAVIFEDGFTEAMQYPAKALSDDKERITYYSNTKKGAVAAKITDAAVSKLLDEINEKYTISLLLPYVKNAAASNVDTDFSAEVETTKSKLREMKAALKKYNDSISSLYLGDKDTAGSLQTAAQNIESSRQRAKSDIAKIREYYNDILESSRRADENVEELLNSLDDAILSLEDEIDDIEDDLIIPIDAPDVIKPLREAADEIRKAYEEGPLKTADKTFAAIGVTCDRIGPLLDSAENDTVILGSVLSSGQDVIDSADASLRSISAELSSLEGNIDDIITAIDKIDARGEEVPDNPLLGKNVKRYAKFLTSPVNMRVKQFYALSTYGEAMTPFYSVLGIWVGAVMLASLLDTHADRKKYPGMTEAQAFFGRYLIFALIGQLQAFIVVLGDIRLLGLSPAEPALLFTAASVTSLVFTMLIYSIVLSFGDVGKGAIVVVMVLQIAGSGGSFPIELLPKTFGAIYRFFPFPYAIGAFREAICGTFGMDFWIDLLKLGVFGFIGVLIGLYIRKPFMEAGCFLSERLEETEVL